MRDRILDPEEAIVKVGDELRVRITEQRLKFDPSKQIKS